MSRVSRPANILLFCHPLQTDRKAPARSHTGRMESDGNAARRLQRVAEEQDICGTRH